MASSGHRSGILVSLGLALAWTVGAPSLHGVSPQPDRPGQGVPCETCHRFARHTSHPVEVVPSSGVPEDLPLEEGRVTCESCHEVEEVAEGGHASAPRLRRADARALCDACHPTMNAGPYRHVADVRHAHDISQRRRSSSSLGVDEQSLICMGCHDGSIGDDHAMSVAAPLDPAGLTQAGPSLGRTHPIGPDYAARAARNPTLVPVAQLDNAVGLPEGRVGCGSCHSVYSSRPRRLVFEQARDHTCTPCHIM